MSDTLLNILQYYGAAASTIAALVVALDLGRRVTGWAFVLFVTSSAALIAWGFLNPDSEGIGWQNIALLAINAVGVYRYLIRKKARGMRNPGLFSGNPVEGLNLFQPPPAVAPALRRGRMDPETSSSVTGRVTMTGPVLPTSVDHRQPGIPRPRRA